MACLCYLRSIIASLSGAATFALIVCLVLASSASPHVIGGSFNTDFDSEPSGVASLDLSEAGWFSWRPRMRVARPVNVRLDLGRLGSSPRRQRAGHHHQQQQQQQRSHNDAAAANRPGLGLVGETLIDSSGFPLTAGVRIIKPRPTMRERRNVASSSESSSSTSLMMMMPPAPFLRSRSRSKSSSRLTPVGLGGTTSSSETSASRTSPRQTQTHPRHEEPLAKIDIHKTSGILTPVSPVSPAPASHPFLRMRREAGDTGSSSSSSLSSSSSSSCSLPADLPSKLRDLNSFLEDSHYVGVFPELGGQIQLPSNQPDSCPAPSGSWWPGQESNLRSLCPWVWTQNETEPDIYPRYIKEAKCLCHNCVRSDVNLCQKIRRAVTVFKLKGCQDGLAVIEQTTVTITVGCFCAVPRPNQASGGHGGQGALPLTQ